MIEMVFLGGVLGCCMWVLGCSNEFLMLLWFLVCSVWLLMFSRGLLGCSAWFIWCVHLGVSSVFYVVANVFWGVSRFFMWFL